VRRRRYASTLVELLVVLGTIAILFALLVPAVEAARAMAEKATCSNNLRQIGLAAHQYHDTHAGFPAGFKSNKKTEPQPRMTWLTQLLPYVEQSGLWQSTEAAYGSQRVPTVNPPHVGFSTPIAMFECPSDDRMGIAQYTHKGYRVALTSYVGVLGTNMKQPDGVLFVDSHVRFVDIVDGASNTIMAGERPPSADYWYGWWYTGYGQLGSGSLDMLLGVREINLGGIYISSCPKGPYDFQAGQLSQECDAFHYWSLHSGGAHFLFADGSVRFLSYQANGVIPALATRAGGEVVRGDY
jgi:prepilin-type processing-associated H-X9-DG protein